MNYLLKSSNFQERKRAARQKILFVIVILVLAGGIIFTRPVRIFLFSTALPIWRLENSLLNSSLFEYFKFKQTLINERIALEQKLFNAGNLLAENSVLKSENEKLKDLLGRKEIKGETVLATILVKPPQSPYDILTVDVGDDHRVKVGDRVIASANVYIGEVTEVFPHSAKITLYSSPSKKMRVIIGDSFVNAEAIGMGGGNFNILLPREVEVKENDVIVIPAINANVFGIVEKVNYKETDSFQTILFKSPINISELNFVEIIL